MSCYIDLDEIIKEEFLKVKNEEAETDEEWKENLCNPCDPNNPKNKNICSRYCQYAY